MDKKYMKCRSDKLVTKNGINLIETESLKDTLLDLHNYAAMGLMLIR